MDNWEQDQIVVSRESWEDEDEVADSWDIAEEVDTNPAVATKSQVKAKKEPPPPTECKIEKVEETEWERKQRTDRLVQESDLDNAMALFGINKNDVNVDQILPSTKKIEKKEGAGKNFANGSGNGQFEAANPQNWTEFENFSQLIVRKIKTFESSKNYPNFLESLVRSLFNDRDVTELRKISGILSELVATKQKEKLTAMKKKAAPSLVGTSKKSGKVTFADFDDDDGDDFDDF